MIRDDVNRVCMGHGRTGRGTQTRRDQTMNLIGRLGNARAPNAESTAVPNPERAVDVHDGLRAPSPAVLDSFVSAVGCVSRTDRSLDTRDSIYSAHTVTYQ